MHVKHKRIKKLYYSLEDKVKGSSFQEVKNNLKQLESFSKKDTNLLAGLFIKKNKKKNK